MRAARWERVAIAAAFSLAPIAATRGQAPADMPRQPDAAILTPRVGVSAGSRQEDDVRTLQLLGVVPVQQWSIRALGPQELGRLAIVDTGALPGVMRRRLCGASCGPSGGVRAGVLPVEASLWLNSARAFGMNDGTVWAGRGVTLAASGGLHARVGPLSAVVAPIVTWAQNQAFPLEPNGQHDTLRFADALFPRSIDHPQRFGDAAYSRVDPGESTLRLDLAGATVGISTAAQWWGPMAIYPYLLGNNAGGFPHTFFGTARPANIGIGRLHARVIYGDLAQSEYSAAADSASRRFASGIVAVFTPKGLPGLEVGGARFFHSIWPEAGIGSAELAKPFEGLLKESSVGRNADGSLREDVHNQLASVFARLALTASGMEVYGEYGREDHNADLRDFWLEPDHDAVYGLGLRRAWRSGAGAVSSFSAEFMNARISHLDRIRPQVAPYLHDLVRQGHTYRGQLLGNPLGARSGDAVTLSWRRHAAAGTTTYSLARLGEAGAQEGAGRLIRIVATVERAVQRGPLEIMGAASLVQREGRDEAASDTNINVMLQTRWTPGLP